MLHLVKPLIKNRTFQIVLILTLYFSLLPFLPGSSPRFFYTISLLIKDLLMWILPLSVCFFIAQAIASFEKKAPYFVLLLFLFEGLSNFISVWFAFGAANIASSFLPSVEVFESSNIDCLHLWKLPLHKPSWWAADKGAMVGIGLGFLSAILNRQFLSKFLVKGKKTSEIILTKFFSKLIPLFILGFVARMHHTKTLYYVVETYSLLIVWIVVILCLYIFFLFFIGNKGSLPKTIRAISNLLPAGSMAFSSGCSVSTMPWTIRGTEKNLKEPHLASSIIPATTNIQQIGDCITNTFLCFLIYYATYKTAPTISIWLHFSSIFVLARFATAACLGGAIFLMLPIYEKALFFNPEMIAIILAFNVILDPIVTSSNVIANGALCKIFETVWLSFNMKIKKIFT